MSELTLYIAAGALFVIGGSLLWAWLRTSKLRWPALALLAVLCAAAALKADWIAGQFSDARAGTAAAPTPAPSGDLQPDAEELLRLLGERDPQMQAWIDKVRQEAAGREDEIAYIGERALSEGFTLIQAAMRSLSGASDASFQELVQLMSRLYASALPDDDEACLAALRGESPEAIAHVEDLVRADAERLLALLLQMARESNDKPRYVVTGEDMQAVMEIMAGWMKTLQPDEIEWTLSVQSKPANALSGPTCRILKSLFAYIAAQPSPQGGHTFRLMFAAQPG